MEEKLEGSAMEAKLEGRAIEDLWTFALDVNDWLSSLCLRQTFCFENLLIGVAQGTE